MQCKLVDKQRKLLLFVWHSHINRVVMWVNPILWDEQLNRFFKHMM